MNQLLLEFFGEEMPANMIAKFAQSLFNTILKEELSIQGIPSSENFQIYYTPRRIVASLNNLQLPSSSLSEEIRGPRLEAPEPALLGFLRKYNLENKSQLTIRDGFYFYTKITQANSLAEAVRTAIENALNKASWPKSMRWGNHNTRWVRPLHSIVCMLNNEVVPINFGHLVANNTTLGHRFLSNDNIVIPSADYQQYQQLLRNHKVVVDATERKQIILQQISAIAQQKSLELLPDEELLDEVANLVEYPVVYCGEIAPQFMKLPAEVLIITLKKNQRYFMLQNSQGELAPYFIIVANIIGEDGGKTIIEGNQKVLRARLSDAMFFFENDCKTPLVSRFEQLDNIVYHTDIGSVAAKVKSVEQMAQKLCKYLNVEATHVLRAIRLMKTDLVTEMVGEFPELQGVMGYYYARNDQEHELVAIAIKEHYKPLGPKDTLPSNEVAALIALADKLDTISQLFAINIRPTGSKDPFALRRAANGILRIIKEYKWPINLEQDLPKLGISPSVIQFILERDVAEK